MDSLVSKLHFNKTLKSSRNNKATKEVFIRKIDSMIKSLPTGSLQCIGKKYKEELFDKYSDSQEINRASLFRFAVTRRSVCLNSIEEELKVSIEINQFSDCETIIVSGYVDWYLALNSLSDIFPAVRVGKQYNGFQTFELQMPQ